MIKLKKSKKVKELERQIESLHVINAELNGRAIKAEREMDSERTSRIFESQRRSEAERSMEGWRSTAIVLIALAIALAMALMISISADAAETKRYTTQKVNLLDKVKGKKVYSVPRNTKVRLIKEGHTWARIRYKGQKLSVRKKYLNAERLPSKERSKYYIRYLRTRGPVHWHGRKYTYYTSRLCPIWLLPVPGLHVDKNGFWCDGKDYIVLGSSVDNKIKRTVYATPFGKFGKVYDTGGYSTASWLCDAAVTW